MIRGRRAAQRAFLPLLFFTLCAAPLGCRTTQVPTRQSGLGEVLPASDPRPTRFLETLREQGRARRSLRGVANLALDGPEGSARAKQIVLLERPARLRVEVLGFLNQSVAVLTTDGDRFHLFRVEEREIEEGAVRPSLLWEVAGIALRPDTAVRVLLGAPNVPEGAPPLPARASGEGGVRVAFDQEHYTVAFEFNATGRLRCWRLESGADGKALLEARYSGYQALAGTQFAHQIELSDPFHGTQARVHFSDVELNPDLPSTVFTLPGRARP